MKRDSETNKIVKEGYLLYLLEEESLTASVIHLAAPVDEIIIPKSLIFLSQEYKITSILGKAFEQTRIKSVRFSEDSEIRCIERCAFSLSSIEILEIPKTLIDLEDGWCHETSHLNRIIISSNNPRFKMYENKMIIGKSSVDSENYDVLVFCLRNSENVEIPDFIRVIGAHSFACCEQIKKVEFSKNSELQIIGESAFNSSGIEWFTVPHNVRKICDGAFSFCTSLEVFQIPDDSELTTIEFEAFAETSFQYLSITPKLIDLKSGWCSGITELVMINVSEENPRYANYDNQMIIGKSSMKSNDYDELVFCFRDLDSVEIPSFIKILGPYSFSNSSIEYLELPPQVTRICNNCFCSCELLTSFEIPSNSQLRTIENESFAWTLIEEFTIPSNCVDLKEDWCYSAKFTSINVDPNNPKYSSFDDNKFIIGKSSIELDYYDVLVFSVRNIKCAKIPNFVKTIDSLSFYSCDLLYDFEIQEDSQLQIIGRYALSCSTIRKISFPKNIKSIMEYAFSSCSQLSKVKFHENSILEKIDKYAFSWTSIESFVIPSQVNFIGEKAFYKCDELRIIEIDENSKMELRYFGVFFDLFDPFLMVPANILSK